LEISLNPKFNDITDEDLERRFASTKLRLKKEKTKLDQLELYRDKLFVQFDLLTETHTNKKPSLLIRLTWMVANWRIRKIQEKIENLNKRIKKHTETVIGPLLLELSDLEEETNLRKSIKTPPI